MHKTLAERAIGLALLSGAGCMSEPVDGLERASVATSAVTVTYNLDDGTPTSNVPWVSGKTQSLSGWVGVDCANQIGSERLLVKLKGWREPSLNADNFIARLTATCRNYEADNALHYNVGFPVVDETDTVFTSDHRDTDTGSAEVVIGGNGNDVPVGIRIKANDADGYVKDFQLLYRVPFVDGLETGAAQSTSYAMGLGGTEHRLECPTDEALTGVQVRYSTNTGKVREIRARCNQLVNR